MKGRECRRKRLEETVLYNAVRDSLAMNMAEASPFCS